MARIGRLIKSSPLMEEFVNKVILKNFLFQKSCTRTSLFQTDSFPPQIDRNLNKSRYPEITQSQDNSFRDQRTLY